MTQQRINYQDPAFLAWLKANFTANEVDQLLKVSQGGFFARSKDTQNARDRLDSYYLNWQDTYKPIYEKLVGREVPETDAYGRPLLDKDGQPKTKWTGGLPGLLSQEQLTEFARNPTNDLLSRYAPAVQYFDSLPDTLNWLVQIQGLYGKDAQAFINGYTGLAKEQFQRGETNLPFAGIINSGFEGRQAVQDYLTKFSDFLNYQTQNGILDANDAALSQQDAFDAISAGDFQNLPDYNLVMQPPTVWQGVLDYQTRIASYYNGLVQQRVITAEEAQSIVADAFGRAETNGLTPDLPDPAKIEDYRQKAQSIVSMATGTGAMDPTNAGSLVDNAYRQAALKGTITPDLPFYEDIQNPQGALDKWQNLATPPGTIQLSPQEMARRGQSTREAETIQNMARSNAYQQYLPNPQEASLAFIENKLPSAMRSWVGSQMPTIYSEFEKARPGALSGYARTRLADEQAYQEQQNLPDVLNRKIADLNAQIEPGTEGETANYQQRRQYQNTLANYRTPDAPKPGVDPFTAYLEEQYPFLQQKFLNIAPRQRGYNPSLYAPGVSYSR